MSASHQPAGTRAPRPVGRVLAVVAVVLLALNLRPGASSAGPLLPEIMHTLGGGRLAEGLLVALPCLVFSVLGMAAVPIARRFGLSGALLLGAAISVLGLALRPAVSSLLPFVVLTVVGLAGAALGNVLVPAWIKRHGGRRAVALMTVYSVMLSLGGAAGTLLAVPLVDAAQTLPVGTWWAPWRTSLLTWAGVFLAAAFLWWAVLRRVRHDFPAPPPSGQIAASVRRSPTAVAMTIMFGLQSSNAYIQMGFLPGLLADAGIPMARAAVLTAIIQVWGILGGLVIPTVIDRFPQQLRWLAAGFGLATSASWLGMLLAPTAAPLLWVSLMGLGGWAFPLGIALIPARTRHPLVTARLSGMVQPVGYLLAAIGPLLIGAVMQVSGSTAPALAILTVGGLALAVAAFVAARPAIVDDELSRAAPEPEE